jgi:hypothetical protein
LTPVMRGSSRGDGHDLQRRSARYAAKLALNEVFWSRGRADVAASRISARSLEPSWSTSAMLRVSGSTTSTPSVRSLIFPIGVGQILTAAGTMGFALLLKAQARRTLLAARPVGSVLSLVLVLSRAATHGVTGAAWGMAPAGGCSSLALAAYALGGWFPQLPPLPVRTPRPVPGPRTVLTLSSQERRQRENSAPLRALGSPFADLCGIVV